MGSMSEAQAYWEEIHHRFDPQGLRVMLDLQAVFADVVGDLAALRSITPQEVVFLVGLSIHNFAVNQYGHKWDDAPHRRARERLGRSAG